jgi:hypothetical protein
LMPESTEKIKCWLIWWKQLIFWASVNFEIIPYRIWNMRGTPCERSWEISHR